MQEAHANAQRPGRRAVHNGHLPACAPAARPARTPGALFSGLSTTEIDVTTTLKQMLEAANAAIPRMPHDQAASMIESGQALAVDVRDAPEVEQNGKVPGAVHVSRGMLEFRADPESPYHDARFAKDKPVILYCASGGRSALAAKTLKDMGYTQVYNLGGFKDWVEAGGAVEKVLDKGM